MKSETKAKGISKEIANTIITNALHLEEFDSIDILKKAYETDTLLSKNILKFENIHDFIDTLLNKSIADNEPFVTKKGYLNVDENDVLEKEIEELLCQNHNKDTTEKRNIKLPNEPSTEDITISDNLLSIELEQLKKLKPTEKMSSYYQIVYYKTLYHWYLKNETSFTDFVDFRQNHVQLENAIESNLFPFHRIFLEIQLDATNFAKIPFCLASKSRIEKSIKSIMATKEYTGEQLEYLRLNVQLIAAILLIDFADNNEKKHNAEAISYLYHYIAWFFLDNPDYQSYLIGLSFAKKSLNIYDFRDKKTAFNILGLLAMRTGGQLQLAYDTYYSWLNNKMVGELKSLYTIKPICNKEEQKWRTTPQGKKAEAQMRTYYAFISACIGDTYETDDVNPHSRRDLFYNIAEKEINQAVNLDPDSALYHETYGAIATSQIPRKTDYLLALDQFQQFFTCVKNEKNIESMTYALNRYNQTIIELLSYNYSQYINGNAKNNSFSAWQNTTIAKEYWKKLENSPDQYKTMIMGIKSTTPVSQKTLMQKEELISQIKFGSHFQDTNTINTITDIALILILIKQTAIDIQNQLRRLEYSDTDYFTRKANQDRGITGKRSGVKTIAYYTTLKNATYLFDELEQASPNTAPTVNQQTSDGKNCLTVVHAKYMNDPYEGLPLLDSLTAGWVSNHVFPKESSKLFREDLYNESYIFLKSFTEKVDTLFMWNRYASDYESDGKNSNGCCIQFDPETFNQIISLSSESESIFFNEDYYLYRMVYISDDGTIKREVNPGITEDTLILYSTLKSLFIELNNKLGILSISKDFEQIKKEVQISLRDSLKSIIFLFKSDDYAEEVESRLIFERKHDEADSIRFVSNNPPKLAINPYKQIYINKIVFGPNVRNEEEWWPYFQYELNKLWTKFTKITGDNSCPPHKRYTIEKSSIHYHT